MMVKTMHSKFKFNLNEIPDQECGSLPALRRHPASALWNTLRWRCSWPSCSVPVWVRCAGVAWRRVPQPLVLHTWTSLPGGWAGRRTPLYWTGDRARTGEPPLRIPVSTASRTRSRRNQHSLEGYSGEKQLKSNYSKRVLPIFTLHYCCLYIAPIHKG